jgi:hypothetical protein
VPLKDGRRVAVTPVVRGWSLLWAVVILVVALTGLMVVANLSWPSASAHVSVHAHTA